MKAFPLIKHSGIKAALTGCIEVNDLLIKQVEKLQENPEHLKKLIAQAKIDNKGLQPYIKKSSIRKCLTCGTVNQSHPETSYCFVCDTDNW